jgi:O-antigen/teichoic acid export membrane protein
VILLALALLVDPQEPTTVGWLFVLACGLTWILGAIWWSKRPNTEATAARIDRGEILASCMPLLGIAILVQVTFWASQIILGVWASSSEIAIFNAAQRTAMLISLVLAAVNSIAAPKFAELYRLNQYDSLRRTSYHVTRLMISFALFPLALMLFFPQHVLQLFGPEFSAGATGMRILAVAQFINVATGSVSFLLSMTGHEKLLRRNVFISAVLTIALGLGLIPGYGLTGAAIATAVGIATNNLLGMWQVRRIHGFNTLAIWR